MYLLGMRIRNFRAIRKASISFDDGTVLIGENDCGISSVLEALELALGFEDKKQVFPPFLFHQSGNPRQASGPIQIELRFRERHKGEWQHEDYAAFSGLLSEDTSQPRELWYELFISPEQVVPSTAKYRLRSPGEKSRSSDPKLIGRFRRMNPVIRVTAGMLTGHGDPQLRSADPAGPTHKVSPEIQNLMTRITRAVDSRLSGESVDLKADLNDGYEAAFELMKQGQFKLGKWEAGLTRSVNEIIGWAPGKNKPGNSIPMQVPDSTQERLGILLLVGALIKARPGGMAPDADPLWIIEEPEAHLHPITLTSVSIVVSLVQRQKIVTTYSGDLLAVVPLGQIRRLVRHNGKLLEHKVRRNILSRNELRRFQYHIRARFGVASFARTWLLVEGESEFWIMPQLAALMGYDFALEGIACVEFAQCGLDPLIKVADELGIQWHVLVDGDKAGQNYAETARRFIPGKHSTERLTILEEADVERYFWRHGYQDVYRRFSKLPESKLALLSPQKVIGAAVRKRSKPFLALSVIEEIAREGSPGIPEELQTMIKTCVSLARTAPSRSVVG